jgi:hypothetical protein
VSRVEIGRSKGAKVIAKSFELSGQLKRAGERYHAGRQETGPRKMAASFTHAQVLEFKANLLKLGALRREPLDELKLEAAIAEIESAKLKEKLRKYGQLVWDTLEVTDSQKADYTGILIWPSNDPEKPFELEYQYVVG